MILRILKGIVVVLFAGVVALVIGIATGQTAGERRVPAGMVRDTALWIPMRDGVKIAVDVWLPPDYAAGQKVPAMMNATRYVRATKPGPVAHWLLRLQRGNDAEPIVDGFNRAGYAVVLVDARGSGASTGTRLIEWSPDEREDYGEVADWIVKQPWSNGRVGAEGGSYEGNTAEILAATGRPAVKAVAPLFDDFDPTVNIAFMGGVLNEFFIDQWGIMNARLDRSDYCALARQEGIRCLLLRQLVAGTKPVDEDKGGRELAAILAARKNYDVLTALKGLVSPLDPFPGTTETLRSVAPSGLAAQLQQLNTPMFLRVGMLDGGTTNVALSRFFTLSNPQQLSLGPWNHGAGQHVDPFLPDSTATDPSRLEQFKEMVQFFDRYLKDGAPATPPVHEIRYYTLNDGRWRTTTQWPPAGMQRVRWYLGEGNALVREAPTAPAATDTYTVDTTASTGDKTTRWHTQLGGSDVIYPDRRSMDTRLLTYTSAPFDRDVEISSVPVVTLQVASTHRDGGFFGYLEDVAPDGRVTYITEGMLRALHRKESTEPPPYKQWGQYHTYTSADTMSLVPGEVATLRFELFVTSVRIKAGHRLRLALAGADRPLMALYPPAATPTWTVHRSAKASSFVELDMADATPR